jgi:hypothetical protein
MGGWAVELFTDLTITKSWLTLRRLKQLAAGLLATIETTGQKIDCVNGILSMLTHVARRQTSSTPLS